MKQCIWIYLRAIRPGAKRPNNGHAILAPSHRENGGAVALKDFVHSGLHALPEDFLLLSVLAIHLVIRVLLGKLWVGRGTGASSRPAHAKDSVADRDGLFRTRHNDGLGTGFFTRILGSVHSLIQLKVQASMMHACVRWIGTKMLPHMHHPRATPSSIMKQRKWHMLASHAHLQRTTTRTGTVVSAEELALIGCACSVGSIGAIRTESISIPTTSQRARRYTRFSSFRTQLQICAANCHFKNVQRRKWQPHLDPPHLALTQIRLWIPSSRDSMAALLKDRPLDGLRPT